MEESNQECGDRSRGGTESTVIALGGAGRETSLDVAQALAGGELGEGQRPVMFGAA